MNFFVGLHQPCDARHFSRCMISINRLRFRKSGFVAQEWMLDSGAFMELKQYGRYRHSAEEYGAQILRWSRNQNMVAAVSQDYMCEPFILAKTGLSVEEHQCLTIRRYQEVMGAVKGNAYIMPVLQGYLPSEYLDHLDEYGSLIQEGQWVGVGSVCKRNADVAEIEQVLVKIRRARPDLRLHGFGVKLTALRSSLVRECLYSADSMAWSYAARRQGRNANSWTEASAFISSISAQEVTVRDFQERLFE